MAKNLVIYYNDSIDSDNWAATRALALAKGHLPDTRVIWIVEPRQVSLGLTMSKREQVECQELIKKHFPGHGNPFKTLLAGLLSEEEINGIEGLDKQERDTLLLAVKPEYGPRKDAILHRTLTAWDHATCLKHWGISDVEVFMDLDSLYTLQNPVNLYMHHCEELIARTEDELDKHESIMNEPLEQRIDRLKDWYRDCIEHAEQRSDNQESSVSPLDFDNLCDAIKAAKNVQFFGGSSLSLLQRFIETGIAQKIDCHLQVGSCDLSVNLFPNQFNIGLNPEAAKFVLARFKEFSSFAVVPSHTAQSVKYSLAGLKQDGGRCLEKKMLGFNCREDPKEIATGQVTLEQNYPGKYSPMPDLTTFLCALIPGFGGSTLTYARVVDEDDVILFREDAQHVEGIPMYKMQEEVSLDESEVVEILSQLEENGRF